MNMLQHVFERLENILQTFQGWITALCILFLNYISGHEFTVGLVMAVTLMDAAWGIAVSIKRGRFALSELARLTVNKFAVYGCAILTLIGIDKVIEMEITTPTIAAVITLVELWSACGSMLIINPQMPFLRLLKKALTGEIAAKLHIEPSEVEEVLKRENKSVKDKVAEEQVQSAGERVYRKKER